MNTEALTEDETSMLTLVLSHWPRWSSQLIAINLVSSILRFLLSILRRACVKRESRRIDRRLRNSPIDTDSFCSKYAISVAILWRVRQAAPPVFRVLCFFIQRLNAAHPKTSVVCLDGFLQMTADCRTGLRTMGSKWWQL